MKKAVILLLAAAAAIVGFAGLSSADAQSTYTGRFNHPSNIIRGGTLTKSEFTTKYRQNGTKDLPAIFGHYGINASKIGEAKEAVVTSSGEVKVNGKTVATGAWSVGRQTLGSKKARAVTINGKRYYEKPMAEAIAPHKAVTAFVFLDKNGNYKSGFLKGCANPIIATPTPPPAPPKPPKKPQPKPAAECKALDHKISNRNNYTLSAQATVANGAKVSAFQYVITDSNGRTVLNRTVQTTGTSSSIQGTLPAGSYTAQVTVKTSVGDRTGKVCTTSFKIPEKPKPPVVKKEKVCELESGNIITINEGDFDSEKHSRNLDDCKEVEVCELDSKTWVTITKAELDANPGKYSENPEDCEEEEVPPVTPEEPEKPEEPEVPEELPQTGLADAVASFLGIGALTTSVSYYVASRRGLLAALLQR